MANCFPFSKSKSIVCEDGTVTWSNQVVSRSPLNFSNTEDSLNETYSTAVDDNETQYLSVLESTHDDTLEDIHNLTLSNHQKLIVQENVELNVETASEHSFNVTESGDQQVVIFNVEGSDEIYGIQLAEDEDGNIHRYQFQFRKTDDGQLEAMPETIQLLSNEEDPPVSEENQDTVIELSENQILETPVYLEEALEQSDENTQTSLLIPEETEDFEDAADDGNVYGGEDVGIATSDDSQVFVKMEKQVLNQDQDEEEEEEEEEGEDEISKEGLDEYDVESLDIKPGFDLSEVKQELLQDNSQHYASDGQESEDTEKHENTVLEFPSEADSYDQIEIPNNTEETIVAYQNFEDDSETSNNPTRYERLFIEERNLGHLNYRRQLQQQQEHEENTNLLIMEKSHATHDSENEDYEIVEGLPVTAEGDMSEDTSSTIYQETEVLYSEPNVAIQTFPRKEKSIPKTTNILKQPTNINKTIDTKKKTILYYMVPNTDQKENLNSLSLNTGNPRSLLKNNIEINKNNDEKKREKLLERRYARSKEAIQAKMFNNFINKTTIPHAPVRQGRLPRKQQIKPVDTRRNEEIIVQEVMVSSKGFVESISDRLKNLDKLEVTSIVELSDSDEDYDPKSGTKKKKKHKKTRPTNTATSDSDTSVIEIFNSDEEPDNSENTGTVKKTRGRPKKETEDNLKRSLGTGSKSGSSDESTPQKKSRTEESSEVESDGGKKEIKCPHCPKTFPSQNSLSTHIQHHNLENSLRNNNNKKMPNVEYKHKCEDCQETFKNSVLLKRHVCSKNDLKNNYKCGVCCKTFRDIVLFNIHKKSHLKENLVKSTVSVTISPKKFTPRASTSQFKVPNRAPVTYKCKECSKICSNQSILAIHEKSHKKFICTSCKATFASKLLLDTHVRIKCVKPASPKDKRLSFKIRKSFVSSPRRSSIRGRSIQPVKAVHPSVGGTTVKKIGLSTATTVNRALKLEPNKNANVRLNRTLHPRANNSLNLKPNNSAISRNTSDSMINASCNLNTSTVKKNINPGLNANSMLRTLDVDAQCDSCPMKFSSLTALFKHKVKNHGLHTPDKRVLESKRKGLHRPLTLHGGIPANERLNKAFQEMRKKLVLAETDPSEESNLFDKAGTQEKSNLSEKPELPEIVISNTIV